MTANMNRTSAIALLALLALASGCASSPPSDEVSVEEAGMLADVRTQRALMQRMAEVPQLSGEQITAEVVDGNATLRGTVRSSVEREMAEQVARSAVGITRVTNELITEN